MRLSSSLAGAVGLSLLAAVALAHGAATGIVRERMEGMSAMAEVLKVLAPMMQGSAAYDGAAVAEGARTIAAHAGEAMTVQFPEGTAGGHSEARPEIWQDWSAFDGFARQLKVFAEGLERAAANGVGGMSMQGGMMGGQGMMGGGGMMGVQAQVMTAEHIGRMPADMAFAMVSQTCTACHTRFRAEEK